MWLSTSFCLRRRTTWNYSQWNYFVYCTVCVYMRVIRWKRRKCVPDQNSLTFTHHLPPQRDDGRGGLQGSDWEGGARWEAGKDKQPRWVCDMEKKKGSLYVSRCRKLLSVVWHPPLIWWMRLCKKTAHEAFLLMDRAVYQTNNQCH